MGTCEGRVGWLAPPYMRCNGSNWAVYSPGSWDGFRNDVWALWSGVIMRLEHHLVGGYVRYISPHIIIIMSVLLKTLRWLNWFILMGIYLHPLPRHPLASSSLYPSISTSSKFSSLYGPYCFLIVQMFDVFLLTHGWQHLEECLDPHQQAYQEVGSLGEHGRHYAG